MIIEGLYIVVGFVILPFFFFNFIENPVPEKFIKVIFYINVLVLGFKVVFYIIIMEMLVEIIKYRMMIIIFVMQTYQYLWQTYTGKFSHTILSIFKWTYLCITYICQFIYNFYPIRKYREKMQEFRHTIESQLDPVKLLSMVKQNNQSSTRTEDECDDSLDNYIDEQPSNYELRPRYEDGLNEANEVDKSEESEDSEENIKEPTKSTELDYDNRPSEIVNNKENKTDKID